jgi:uncharacterized protein YeaO (DUF488 family)
VPIRTKRWNDPAAPDDGFRLLITRYRPRGVTRVAETWDAWWPELAPSRELLAAYHGKSGPPITFEQYTPRYLQEMQGQPFRLRALADRARAGETITLLCSSACTDPRCCHRTLLAQLLETAAAGRPDRTRGPPRR